VLVSVHPPFILNTTLGLILTVRSMTDVESNSKNIQLNVINSGEIVPSQSTDVILAIDEHDEDEFVDPTQWRPGQSLRDFLSERIRTYVIKFIRFLWYERITIFFFALSMVLTGVLLATAWKDLPENGKYTTWVTVLTVAVMVRNWFDPDVGLFLGVTLLLLKEDLIMAKEAFAGFSNESIVTIGLMMMVAQGVEDTGAMEYVSKYILRNPTRFW
jgi:hypothetical protein